MTEKLYDKDSFINEFTATVISCKNTENCFEVVLDRTAFFPEGGGQPSDIGFLNGAEVFDVQITDGVITHFTKGEFNVGQAVTGKLNFERRFDFMQQHSAEHIVSGIAHRLYGCENVGFHLSEDIVTFDFNKPLTRREIIKVEELANNAVFENRQIHAYYPNKQELGLLNYRSKKELEGAVRIVEIEKTDMCACCAPHVKSTGQIGLIKLLSTENLRGGVRIELKAGARALRDYNERFESTAKVGDLLAVKYNEIAEAVERLVHNNAMLKSSITGLKKQITEQRINAFTSDKSTSAEFEEDIGIKELQIYADALYKKAGGIRAVLSARAENTYMFAICGEPQSTDKLFESFKEAFTVKGGGRNGMAQGTVFATEEELKVFFNEYKFM